MRLPVMNVCMENDVMDRFIVFRNKVVPFETVSATQGAVETEPSPDGWRQFRPGERYFDFTFGIEFSKDVDAPRFDIDDLLEEGPLFMVDRGVVFFMKHCMLTALAKTISFRQTGKPVDFNLALVLAKDAMMKAGIDISGFDFENISHGE